LKFEEEFQEEDRNKCGDSPLSVRRPRRQKLWTAATTGTAVVSRMKMAIDGMVTISVDCLKWHPRGEMGDCVLIASWVLWRSLCVRNRERGLIFWWAMQIAAQSAF
jgi:hypothetical protein